MLAVSGAKHFILFIDDYTRMTWVYFLPVKIHKETLEALKVFQATKEKTAGHPISRFRCDYRHREYDNRFFLECLSADGISYKPAAPYMPNLTGVSEKKIPAIVEWARTRLLKASLPECFWGDVVAMAVYILNRSPMKALTGKTLFEAWFGSRPNLAHLRHFGCDAYVHVPVVQGTNLKPKARLCMFLEYVPNTTWQWRLWDARRQKIVIGWNVGFNENCFGNRRPEDPKMFQAILYDQTGQLSPWPRSGPGPWYSHSLWASRYLK